MHHYIFAFGAKKWDMVEFRCVSFMEFGMNFIGQFIFYLSYLFIYLFYLFIYLFYLFYLFIYLFNQFISLIYLKK